MRRAQRWASSAGDHRDDIGDALETPREGQREGGHLRMGGEFDARHGAAELENLGESMPDLVIGGILVRVLAAGQAVPARYTGMRPLLDEAEFQLWLQGC